MHDMTELADIVYCIRFIFNLKRFIDLLIVVLSLVFVNVMSSRCYIIEICRGKHGHLSWLRTHVKCGTTWPSWDISTHYWNTKNRNLWVCGMRQGIYKDILARNMSRDMRAATLKRASCMQADLPKIVILQRLCISEFVILSKKGLHINIM